MQWKKIRTYLIIALFIVNIVLIISILKQNEKYRQNFTKKNLNNIKTILSENNISYDFEINTKTSNMYPIVIHYAKPDDAVYKKIRQNYSNSIKIIDNIYVDLEIKKNISNYNEFLEFCNKFIEDNLEQKNYVLKEVVNENNNMMITYEEIYDKIPLEQGFVSAIYSQGTININILKIKDIQKADKNIKIMSNAQAISKLLPQLHDNTKILSLDRCYYFKEYEERITTEKLESLRLLPFYRAKLENGEFLYTPAMIN